MMTIHWSVALAIVMTGILIFASFIAMANDNSQGFLAGRGGCLVSTAFFIVWVIAMLVLGGIYWW